MTGGTRFASSEAEQRYAALARHAADAVVAFDFDGTVAPIVDDPTQARIHPEGTHVLQALAGRVKALAVVTGRPAAQVLDLGGLEATGDAVAARGTDLYVFGQYGNERWSTAERRVLSPDPPPGLAAFLEALPPLLADAGAADAWIEEKGLAVAVHTRRLPDPQAAYERLVEPMRALARDHDLVLEPGRQVVEVRAGGMHKGTCVHTLVDELGAGAFLFAGDDLGDVEAFDAVDELAGAGMPTLLVCSASEEQSALATRADVVVPGPDGVLGLFRALARDSG